MKSPATIRCLNAPADFVHCAAMDLSFTANRVLVVEQGGRAFVLTEQVLASPFEGRYDVEWTELVEARLALVAELDGRVVGIASLSITEWNRRATIAHLYVDRTFRGQGIGIRLLEALAREATISAVRTLWVEARSVNPDAIRFYEQSGFALCGLDVTLYDPAVAPGETAIFLSRAVDAGFRGID